jgi:hypothetical protein
MAPSMAHGKAPLPALTRRVFSFPVQQVGLIGVLGAPLVGPSSDVPFRTRFQEGVGPRTGAFFMQRIAKLGVLYETALCPSSRTDFSKGAVGRRVTRPRRLFGRQVQSIARIGAVVR